MSDELVVWGWLLAVLVIFTMLGICVWYMRTKTQVVNSYLHRIDKLGMAAYPLAKAVTRLGRHRYNDIVLSGKTVSRFHAKIVRSSAGEFLVVDKRSTNHTYIGKSRVAGSARLYDGAMIKIGSAKIQFSSDPIGHNPYKTMARSNAVIQPPPSRRRSQRVPITVTVRYRHETVGWKKGTARNLSGGGMFVKTKTKSLEVGSNIEIIFPVQASRHVRWLRFPGKLVRHAKYGVGVAFSQLDPNSREALKNLDRAA